MLLFNFTEEQLALLAHLERIEAAKKLEIQFDNPDNDTLNLRRAVYLDGSMSMVRFIQEFDSNLIAEREAEKVKRLPNSDPTNQDNFNPNLGF